MVHLTKTGFTLVELLVSISIIATLTAILLPNLMGARDRAKDSQVKQDLDTVKSSLRLYYNDHQAYPGALNSWLNINDTGPGGIGSSLLPYLPNAASIIGQYEAINNFDGFWLKAGMQASTPDIQDSQSKCGYNPVTDGDQTNPFIVCAY